MRVRPCATPDEMRAAFAPIWHYFGQSPPPEEGVKHFRRILPAERVHAAFEGEIAVAGSAAFEFDLTVPGAQMKAAGITIVGVLPTHRRRGLLKELIRSQIDAAHARGEPVAVLWPSEDAIYNQFGFGMASLSAEIDVPRERTAAYKNVDLPGTVRIVPPLEAEPLVAPVYARVARDTPGMFARSSAWWQDRLLTDRPWRRQGGGELQCVVLEISGAPAAYAFYRLNPAFEHGSSTGTTFVVEAMGETPAATHAIWCYLFNIDWLARVKAGYMQVDHPLLLSVAEPRRLGFRIREGIAVRLIDVGAALSARTYAADDSVVIDVADEFCPWNAGRWRVGRDGASRTSAEADLGCEVNSLGCVYLGGFTFAQLSRALRVQELREGAIARADAMFYTDRAPWCPELF
jgi:predicted acetyltransferase